MECSAEMWRPRGGMPRGGGWGCRDSGTPGWGVETLGCLAGTQSPNLSCSQGGAWAPGQLARACDLIGPAVSARCTPPRAGLGVGTACYSGGHKSSPSPGASWEPVALIKRGGSPAGARLPRERQECDPRVPCRRRSTPRVAPRAPVAPGLGATARFLRTPLGHPGKPR